MHSDRSPIVEILGITIAAVTVVTSAGVLLKYELHDVSFASLAADDGESSVKSDEPHPESPPSNAFIDSMAGFSSASNRAASERIYRALEKPCPTLDYPGETDLQSILDAIFNHLRDVEDETFTVIPDVGALNNESMVLADVVVKSVHIEGVSIRSALDVLLEQTDPQLDYMVRSEMLLITTRQAAEADENLTIRIYDIGHLVTPQSGPVFRYYPGQGRSQSKTPPSNGSQLPTSQQLAMWVMESSAPPARWFEIDGEGGRLQVHNRMLIVRQSRRAHLAISDLLEQLTERSDLLRK